MTGSRPAARTWPAGLPAGLALLLAAGCSSGPKPAPLTPVPGAVAPAPTRPGVAHSPGVDVPDTMAARPVLSAREKPDVDVLDIALGEATYYADKFNGRRTASGIVFSNTRMYAAHLKYPFGTIVRVTNLRNDKSVVLQVVDRGPHGNPRTIIDVSRSAAEQLEFIRAGRVPVRVEVLEWGGKQAGPR